MIKQSFKVTKYLLIAVSLGIFSCSTTGGINDTGKGDTKVAGSNIGPGGGGSIDPKVKAGYTTVALGNGTSNLTLSLKLTSDGMPAFLTKAKSGFSTKADEPAAEDPLSGVETVQNDLEINGETFKFEIPKKFLVSGGHDINLTGLEMGDDVNLDSKAYDKDGKVIGEQKVKDKKVTKDEETVNVSIPISISNSNTNTNTNTQNTNQSVGNVTGGTSTTTGGNINATAGNINSGNTIIVNIPTPPPGQGPGGGQPPQPAATPASAPASAPASGPPASGAPASGGSCLQPDANHMVTFEGQQVQICPPPEQTQIEGCKRPDQNFMVTLDGGKSFSVCKPPGK